MVYCSVFIGQGVLPYVKLIFKTMNQKLENFMKVLLTKTSKLFFVSALILSLIGSTGCDKDDNQPVKKYGKIALLNGAFGTDSLNLFIDNRKVNSKLIAYSDSLNYVEIEAGDRSAEARKKDNTSLTTKATKIEANKNYSLLITNSANGQTFESILVSDDLAAPAENKAKIRFIHLSPDVVKLNLETTGGTKVFENINYKNAGLFKDIDAQKTSFKIVDPETNTVLATLTDLDIVKGKIYTVWSSGLKVTEDNKKKLQANAFVNK